MKKVAVYTICKNEMNNVAEWLMSVEGVDQIVMLDTGSEDNTPATISASGVEVTYIEALFEPFDFSRARNMALSYVKPDIEYCVYLDLDERLEEGWLDSLRAYLQHDPHQVSMKMVLTVDDSDAPETTYHQVRCHRRESYAWIYPCHEVLNYIGPDRLVSIAADIEVRHLKDASKKRDYLSLLENGVNSHPQDQRMAFYLGREYFYEGEYKMAYEKLLYATTCPILNWDMQVAECYLWLSKCSEKLGLDPEPWLIKRLSVSTDHAEFWCDLALYYFELDHYAISLGFAMRAISLQDAPLPTNYLFRDEGAYTWKPYDIAAYCYYYLEDYPSYAIYCGRALQLNPNSTKLQQNLASALRLINGEVDDYSKTTD